MATLFSPGAPGVYVQEVPSSIKAIAGAGTSTAAFVGIVPDTVQLPARDAATRSVKFVDYRVPFAANVATLITSWPQFTRVFGDLVGDSTLPATAVQNPATDAGYVQLAHAVFGFFNNGGTRCFVVRAASEADIDAALASFAPIEEIAIVAAPGQIGDVVRQKLVDHCAATGDRFAILDGPEIATDLTKLTVVNDGSNNGGLMPKATDLAAWYYPWVKVFDPGLKLQDPTGEGLRAVPPSGHVAGIYARVDTQRGVFKAPANEAVRGAVALTHSLSRADQDGLNPVGVNCLRLINGSITVWGARTVGGDTNADLKYVNVRRTLLFIRDSIESGLSWAVFEPNTPALWARISRNTTAFLTTLWRAGALFGSTPQEAFFVKCDADNNSPELGQVVTDVGVAIARPAEFVVFRISQFSGSAQ